jgi:hypothetical protein
MLLVPLGHFAEKSHLLILLFFVELQMQVILVDKNDFLANGVHSR